MSSVYIEKIYPEILPSAPQDDEGQTYRLKKSMKSFYAMKYPLETSLLNNSSVGLPPLCSAKP